MHTKSSAQLIASDAFLSASRLMTQSTKPNVNWCTVCVNNTCQNFVVFIHFVSRYNPDCFTFRSTGRDGKYSIFLHARKHNSTYCNCFKWSVKLLVYTLLTESNQPCQTNKNEQFSHCWPLVPLNPVPSDCLIWWKYLNSMDSADAMEWWVDIFANHCTYACVSYNKANIFDKKSHFIFVICISIITDIHWKWLNVFLCSFQSINVIEYVWFTNVRRWVYFNWYSLRIQMNKNSQTDQVNQYIFWFVTKCLSHHTLLCIERRDGTTSKRTIPIFFE